MQGRTSIQAGQDVSQMLSAATWWFVWLYNSNTPPQTYQNTVLIREKLSSVEYPDRNFCLRVAPKPYQWHAYNEFIQKMSQRDPLKKIILSFFFCNSLVSRRYPWSVPFPFFGSLSTLRKIHDYPVIVLTRRNFPLPFKAEFTLRSLDGQFN